MRARAATFLSSFVGLACATFVLATPEIASGVAVSGQQAYFCKRSNGAQGWQLEPCAPGAQLQTGRVVDGSSGLIEPDVATPQPTPAPVTAPSAPDAAIGNARLPPGLTPASASKESRDKTLREGQMAVLKLLGFGLAFGLLAKLSGRSFLRWFIGGAVVRVVLVSLGVLAI